MTTDLLAEFFTTFNYRYDEHTVLLETDCLKKKFSSSAEFDAFVEQVSREFNIIFYVPAGNKELLASLMRLGFAQHGDLQRLNFNLGDTALINRLRHRITLYPIDKLFSRYALIHGKPADHKELTTLLEAYLLRHRQTFLDRFGSVDKILHDEADYHFYAGRKGEPLAFHKVIATPPYGREAEITFGLGTPRQNVAMIVNSLLEEEKHGCKELEMNIPYDSVSNLVVKLGAERGDKLLVLFKKGRGSSAP